MSIRKRVWTSKGETKEAWVHDYKDQENKRRSQQFDRKKDAEANERRVEREKHAGIHTPDSKTVTFEYAADLWFRDCERRHKIKDRMAGGTLRNYDRALRGHVLPALGKMLLTKVDTQVAEKLVHGKAGELGRNSLNGLAIILAQVMKFAVKHRWLTRSPFTDHPIRKLPRLPKTRKNVATAEEVACLLQSLSKHRHWTHVDASRSVLGMVTVGALTGMRIGEVCGLQWEDVDWQRDLLHVRHNLTTNGRFSDGLKSTKSGRARWVPMVAPLRACLEHRAARSSQQPTGYVFTRRTGLPYDPKSACIWFSDSVRAAGLVDSDGRPKFTFHGLRHATVSILHSIGVPVADIARIVGHSRPSTTMEIYVDAIMPEAALRQALEAMAGQMNLPAPRPATLRLVSPPPQPVIEHRPAPAVPTVRGLSKRSIDQILLNGKRQGISIEESIADIEGKRRSLARRAELKAQALQLRQEGVAPVEIASMLGLQVPTIVHWLACPEAPVASHALPKRDTKQPAALELSRGGMSARGIATKLGVPQSTVYMWLQRARVALAASDAENGFRPPGCSKDAARPS